MSFGKNIVVTATKSTAKMPNLKGVAFGSVFAPSMFQVDWTQAAGWGKPEIMNYGPMSIPPEAGAIHYGLQCFEGMKAYTGQKGEIRLFRPMMNVRRLQKSMHRLCFPTFAEDDLMHALKELLIRDKAWIPAEKGYSLYIRPTAIGLNRNLGVGVSKEIRLFIITSPVGPYYSSGFKPVKLFADTKNHRAWPGGTGEHKLGANYAGPIFPTAEAVAKGFHQVLWLGPDDVCDEVGAMNFMVMWKNKQGEVELVTAPIDGTILPGVTRDSILTLARQWGEFKVTERRFTIHEIVEASEQGRLIEAFGCGTAAIVSPIEGIQVGDKYVNVPVPEKSTTVRFFDKILNIQYGCEEHEWGYVVA